MTRPRKPASPRGKNNSGAQPASKGARGHAPKKMTAQGRGSITREGTRPVRETSEERAHRTEVAASDRPAQSGPRSSTPRRGQASPSGSARQYGSATPSRSGAAEGRKSPPKLVKKPLPELKRVQLNAPAPDTTFMDRDGQRVTFPDSNLRRVAAQILTDFHKPWRYRAFDFPLFTDRGHEQAFHFDFYIYDAEDSVIRLILVIPFESREVWDKVGRFKRQYPMYTYELWTPEKLAALSGPKGRLGW